MKTTAEKLFTIVLSIVMFVSLLPMIPFAATTSTMSYDEYFSQDRALIGEMMLSSNKTWENEPFLVYDFNLDFIKNSFSDVDYDIQIGDVYQERVVGEETELYLFCRNATSISFSGTNLFVGKGSSIYHWNLDTLVCTTIFVGLDLVSNISAFKDVVFFQSGNSIYRYHIASQKTDLLLTEPALNYWVPESNLIILVGVENPNFLAAIAISGGDPDSIPEDPEILSHWLNSRFGLSTNPQSTLFTNCDVSNILTACGISQYNQYWYDTSSKMQLDAYTPPSPPEISSINSTSDQNSQSGTTLAPLDWKYPSGSYFSVYKTSHCLCHGYNYGCDTTWRGNCDCQLFEAAIQCNGYARYMFHEISGFYSRTNGVVYSGTVPSLSSSVSTLRTFFQSRTYPIVFTAVSRRSGVNHTILIYDANSTGILMCEANTDRYLEDGDDTPHYCYVANEISVSYSELYSRFSRVVKMICAPSVHNHSLVWGHNSSQHWKTCANCDVIAEATRHSNVWGTTSGSHWQQCSVCGNVVYGPEDHWYYWEHNSDYHWEKCDMCRLDLSPEEPHSFTYDYNDNYHWATCSGCYYVTPREQHTWSDDSDACSTCGYD